MLMHRAVLCSQKKTSYFANFKNEKYEHFTDSAFGLATGYRLDD
jgi:hypothetical protein